MQNNIIFLDYCSTTPIDPHVAQTIQAVMTSSDTFGNPSSQHAFGKKARALIENARTQIAETIHAKSAEIIFTSGATESINLALKGAAQFYQRQGKHIITMQAEHKAVLDTCAHLTTLGFEITYLPPEKNGLLSLDALKKAIRRDTILISVMHVNNETGVIQPISAIAEIAHAHGALLHVDAAQSIGKINVRVDDGAIDLLSLSSHKIYGPKGVGALFIKQTPRVQLMPQMHGGEQEMRVRSGTLATHQIVGVGEAFHLASQLFSQDQAHIKQCRDYCWKAISKLSGVHCNSDEKYCVPSCLNIRFDDVPAEKLLNKIPEIAISTGSACNAVDPEPSHVLIAMGLSRKQANESVRLSFGRYTTLTELDAACEKIKQAVEDVRSI